MTEKTDLVNSQGFSPEVMNVLKKAALAQAESEQVGVPFLSLKGKKFSLGEEKLGTRLKGVILATAFDNAYYDRKYDPSSDEVFPPACFAISETGGGMEPHETSPVKQSDACTNCPKNEFGSAAQGSGKACRNGRRILIASVDDSNSVNFSDLAIINMSPTALKSFSRYVKSVTSVKQVPLWSVCTTFGFEEEPAYPVLTTTFDGILEVDDINIIVKRLEEFQELVSVPYDTSNYEPPAVEAKEARKSKMS